VPSLSVVIPVLDDAAAVARVLPPLLAEADVEVILVDGAADSQLDVMVSALPRTRLLRCAAGRARQMNEGAREASADWILFLHADSELPPRWRAGFAAIAPGAIAGWFRFALDDRAWQARVIERLVAWRVRTLALPYGDQGLFVRRDVFEQLGGFDDLPLLEDVEFIRRLAGAGALAEVPLPLRTSARRWRRDGWFRRSARNTAIVALYFAGVSPSRLARWYGLAQRE
jgi:rSAM/selenodomain-associated transferase 2